MGIFGRKERKARDDQRESERENGLPLTRRECLQRLRECWERAEFSHELTDAEREHMSNNFSIVTLYVRLLGWDDDAADVRAIGFQADEEADEEEDEEDGE